MKQIGAFLIFTVSLLLCAISFGQEQAPAPTARAPKYSEGDRWYFRVIQRDWLGYRSNRPQGDYEISYTNGKFLISRVIDDKKIPVAYEQEESELLRLTGLTRGRLARFPLYVGKTWSGTYKYNVHPVGWGMITYTMKFEAKVLPMKEAKTEAGIFPALEIEMRDFNQWVDTVYTFLYSGTTKSFLKLRTENKDKGFGGGRTEIELVRFSSQKDVAEQ